MRIEFAKIILKNLLFALLIFVCANAAYAETIAAYRAKIHAAKILVDNIFYGDEDESGAARKHSGEADTVKKLRNILPVSEKVESKNASVATQNEWFSERLDAYEKENDPAKRAEILKGISERLGAIEAEVGALETAIAAARAKDEDKQKLAEILAREEFQKPPAPEENIFQKIWRKIAEWLDGVFPRSSPFSIPEGGLSSLSFLIQIIIYLLVFALIGFFVYKFAPFLSAKFGKFKREEKSERVVLGETLGADADSHTLFAEAEKLAREGQLRAAIRKGYIALLCDLSDRQIVSLAKNKTNRDYLRDVRLRTEIFEDIKNLTTNFERNWYGFGSPKEQDWNEFRESYGRVIKN